jgi:hypothetical protein
LVCYVMCEAQLQVQSASLLTLLTDWANMGFKIREGKS